MVVILGGYPTVSIAVLSGYGYNSEGHSRVVFEALMYAVLSWVSLNDTIHNLHT
jgi:hypothetical protein